MLSPPLPQLGISFHSPVDVSLAVYLLIFPNTMLVLTSLPVLVLDIICRLLTLESDSSLSFRLSFIQQKSPYGSVTKRVCVSLS